MLVAKPAIVSFRGHGIREMMPPEVAVVREIYAIRLNCR